MVMRIIRSEMCRLFKPKVALVTLSSNKDRIPDDLSLRNDVQVLGEESENELVDGVCVGADLIVLHNDDAGQLEEVVEAASDRSFVLLARDDEHRREDPADENPVLQIISSSEGHD